MESTNYTEEKTELGSTEMGSTDFTEKRTEVEAKIRALEDERNTLKIDIPSLKEKL